MSIIKKIAAAGIVGCGGAGFPTHVKLNGKFEYFIINGAECEPLLRNDQYLMRNKAPELVEAIMAVADELQIPNRVFALKHHYQEEIKMLQKAITEANANIVIHEMESYYPAGDEQSIVYEVTGRVVPPAGLPGNVGAVVDNVATIYEIYHALHERPFIYKYLTVTGEVNHPTILKVPIGTSFRECLELAGGTKTDQFFVVNGGPMMGRSVPKEELEQAVVTKTTSGILVLPEDGYHGRTYGMNLKTMLNHARSACIQCSYCTQLCPRHLLGHPLEPHRIMRTMAVSTDLKSMLDQPVIQNAQLCCECGICETFACPMGLQPRKINGMIKRELAAAGFRYQREKDEWDADENREMRKAPSEKVAARVGVRKYYHYEIKDLVAADPSEVRIPLKMNVGAPSIPCVDVGMHVQAGDIIAKAPEGALGAMIHASITGTVVNINNEIVIAKGQR